jgi:diguanylate cyclase (GGDEF)-like protein
MVAVLLVDVDRFTLINDALGHRIGDELLKAIATRLTGSLRASDLLARIGGDEFGVILEDLGSPAHAARVAHKLLDTVAAPLVWEGHEVVPSLSIGISLYPSDHVGRDELINKAETALAVAKEEGNTFRFFSAHFQQRAFERLSLETGLRHALKRGEFTLQYQPLVDCLSGRLVGVEALLRWQHPERGVLHPNIFLPVAEDTGLMIPIGEWVLKTACAQAKIWQEHGHPQLRVAVNLSRRQLQHHTLVHTVSQVLRTTGLEPQCLELEVPEQLLVQDPEATIATLVALHKLGVRLALDDFGADRSVLGCLKRLPLSSVKIDHSFIRNIATNPDDGSLTRALITLGRCLNLNVIAEGVETEWQAKFLKAYRCHELQGYYVSQPLTAEELTAFLTKSQTGAAATGLIGSPHQSDQV